MTLLDLIVLMEKTARRQPSVKSIVANDVFKLNAIPDVRYGVFAWTQGVHRGSVDGDLITFSFSLFYVDRLTRTGDNTEEVQSVGVQTLDNILLTLADRGVAVEQQYTFQPFTQRFLDECAGVYATVSLSVPRNTVCGFPYAGDFNEDFNEDYERY